MPIPIPHPPYTHTLPMRLAVLGDHQPPGIGIFRAGSWAASFTQDSRRNKRSQNLWVQTLGAASINPWSALKSGSRKKRGEGGKEPGQSREGGRGGRAEAQNLTDALWAAGEGCL